MKCSFLDEAVVVDDVVIDDAEVLLLLILAMTRQQRRMFGEDGEERGGVSEDGEMLNVHDVVLEKPQLP